MSLSFKLVFFLFPFELLILPCISLAGGPVHGAKAAGMGTAFVAVADDPSAIAFNPAGLNQMRGTNIYGGLALVIPSSTYGSPSGQSESTDFQVFPVPHFYISSDFQTRDLRLGLGVYSPFGIGGRKWSETGLTRFISTESTIATISINPTVSYQLFPSLSVGIGIDYMIARTESEQMVDQSSLMAPDGKLSVKGIGGGWGYNLGILYILQNGWSFGLAYRSRIKVNYHGDFEFSKIAPALQPLLGGPSFKTDMNTTNTFPDILSLGIAYRPTPKWTVSLDLEWGGWSSFDRAEIKLDKQIPQAGITNRSISLDWKDVWSIKMGAEYKAWENLFLRGGYAYLQTPVPENTLGPANPDSNQHNFSLGLGYKRGKIIFDFFYMVGLFEDRKVQNNILSGQYQNFIQYFGFSIGKGF